MSGPTTTIHDPLPPSAVVHGWKAWAECSCGRLTCATADWRGEAVSRATQARDQHIADMAADAEEAGDG